MLFHHYAFVRLTGPELRKLLAEVDTPGTESSVALRVLLATCVRTSGLGRLASDSPFVLPARPPSRGFAYRSTYTPDRSNTIYRLCPGVVQFRFALDRQTPHSSADNTEEQILIAYRDDYLDHFWGRVSSHARIVVTVNIDG